MAEYIHCNHIWDEEGLSFHAKGIYCLLAKHVDKEGKCWPSFSRLKEMSGLSESTVKRALKELSVSNFIKIKSGKKNGVSNFYTLPVLDKQGSSQEAKGRSEGTRGRSDRPTGSVTQTQEVGHADLQTISNNYSIELYGESQVLTNLVELYKKCSPLNLKEFGLKTIFKARDNFEVAIKRGTKPDKLAKAIEANPNKSPWDIVKKANGVTVGLPDAAGDW